MKVRLLGVVLILSTIVAISMAQVNSESLNIFNHCDSKTGWVSGNPSGVTVDTLDYKEGSACLSTTGSGVDEFRIPGSGGSIPGFDAGVGLVDGCFTFWYYVSDISMLAGESQIEISSSGMPDLDEYNWPVPVGSLVNGWNRISLALKDAGKSGSPNLKSINYFRLYNFKKGIVTTKIDAIGFTGSPDVEPPMPPMDPEPAPLDEIPAATELVTVFDNCDSADGWSAGGVLAVDNSFVKEGSGSLAFTGTSEVQFRKQFINPVNSGITRDNGYLEFWYYIEDVNALTTVGQIEITSSGQPDNAEYSWPMPVVKLKNGWNKIQLALSQAGNMGNPDLSAVNWFRLYCFPKAGKTVKAKIDDIRFTRGHDAPPVIDNCDSNSGWLSSSGSVSVDNESFMEGAASLKYSGIPTVRFSKNFPAPVNAANSIDEQNGLLEFWLYVGDISLITKTGAVELGNGNSNKYYWPLPLRYMNSGWNLIQLKLSEAERAGSPNLSAISWFSISYLSKNAHNVNKSVTARLDGLRFRNMSQLAPEVPKPGGYIKPQPKIITTVYPTEDIVIADFIATNYGADPAGVKDSTAAINKALDDCYNAGGGSVWLPLGKYKVTGTINVKAFCTLRGDWNDPDKMTPAQKQNGDYGTVLIADVPSRNDHTPGLVRIGGSAGVKGITVYYPNQNASNPVPYPYTFEIPGRAWEGEINYMMSSVINCTMINSFKGIGISITPNDRGSSGGNATVHEIATISNVKGTALYCGVEAYNGADVGTWENVKFHNKYWAEATCFNPPAATVIDAWTIANGYGFKFGDLEWDQFIGLEASNYKIGIKIVPGQRIAFAGEFLYTKVTGCQRALEVTNLDQRWGVSFLRSELSGNPYAVLNYSSGYVQMTDCAVSGLKLGGNILSANPGTTSENYPWNTSVHKPTRDVLYKALDYKADRTGKDDSTQAIQKALNDAGKAGGGIVYLSAGWYKILGHITVPANVELRGSSSTPNRCQSQGSMGAVLMGYEGKATGSPDTAPALVTLNGNNAGIRGLRFFYPENNPAADEGIKAYPYTIRGNGSNQYVIDIGLSGVYNGVDFRTNRCNNHFIRKVAGIAYQNGIVIGASNEGWIEGCLMNGNAVCRVWFGIDHWVNEGQVFTKVIDQKTRPDLRFIVIDGSSNEHLLNNFSYGCHNGVEVLSGTAEIFNLGTDNLGTGGVGIKAGSAPVNNPVKVYNYMRYNGSDSDGNVLIYNEMHI